MQRLRLCRAPGTATRAGNRRSCGLRELAYYNLEFTNVEVEASGSDFGSAVKSRRCIVGESLAQGRVGDPPLTPSVLYFGFFSRGIWSGSTSNLIDLAIPGLRLMNPFSSSLRII